MFVFKKTYEALKADFEELYNLTEDALDQLEEYNEKIEEIINTVSAAPNGTTKKIIRQLTELLYGKDEEGEQPE